MNDRNQEQDALADIEKGAENLPLLSLSAKQIRLIAGLFVLALFGSNGLSGLGIWRADRFGHKDFDEAITPTLERMRVLEHTVAEHRSVCRVTKNRLDSIEENDEKIERQLRDHERLDEQRFREDLRLRRRYDTPRP